MNTTQHEDSDLLDKEKVLQRLKKLMALAARAGTEEEAATAQAKVHELLARYNLKISQVENLRETAEIDKQIITERYNEKWRRVLMHASADLFFCKYFYTDAYVQGVNSTRTQIGVNHVFVGRPHNSIVAAEMGTYLVTTVNRLANEGSQQLRLELRRAPTSTERGRYVNSFRLACAARLSERLRQLRVQAEEGWASGENNTRLPALRGLYLQELDLIDSWLEKQRIKLQVKKSRARISSIAGAQDGRRAAEGVNLDRQLGGGKNPTALASRRLIGNG